jgi:transposase-like protein
VILQIDESLFCHKANDNRGRRASKEQWVFGIADTSYKPAITYMEVVQKHDADTLLPIIERIACPGSIIHSDQWRVYHSIHQRLQLDHGTVNHSLNFVDPETGVHTQAIESYWAKAKQKFKTMKGVSADALPTYLDERMWRDRFGKTTEAAFKNLCAHIAEQYKKSVIY